MREYTFTKKDFELKVLSRVISSKGVYVKYLSEMGEVKWKLI